MRLALMTATVVLLTASAQAKPGTDPELRLSAPASDYAIAVAVRGAMLESDYFKAPSQRITSGTTCRMYFDPFQKDRLASLCR